MKKLLFTALAVAAFGGTQASAMSYHDNDVNFGHADFQIVSYEITASCVTDGQDPHGDLNPGKSATVKDENVFMFHCGRHNSSTVADWIKAHVTYEESILTLRRTALPNKANFATIGTMKLMYNGTQYAFENVLFAQYGSESGNLWVISQVGARDLGVLVSCKCATIHGNSSVSVQENVVVQSRLSLPLCPYQGNYNFSDRSFELKDNGYLPIEEIVTC